MDEHVQRSLFEAVPCRESQIRQLCQLLSFDLPHLVVHGIESTGKSLTIRKVLEAGTTPFAIVQSRECITTRHLLERTLSAVRTSSTDTRCESISVFSVQLQRLVDRRFILVFDGIDRQREAPPNLLPALSLLGEIPNLTVVFVVNSPTSHPVPHLYFPQYTRSEILALTPSLPVLDDTTLWPRFASAVYDSLGPAARDLPSFRTACRRLWPPFIEPVLQGHYSPREFSKLMIKNRPLFQSEAGLVDNLPSKPFSLPYIPSHLLLAAYLASHNPPRTDIPLLSKTTSRRKKQKIVRRLAPQAFGLERMLAIYHTLLGEEKYRGGDAEVMAQFATLVGLRLVSKVGVGETGDVLGAKWKCNVGWDLVRAEGRRWGIEMGDLTALDNE